MTAYLSMAAVFSGAFCGSLSMAAGLSKQPFEIFMAASLSMAANHSMAAGLSMTFLWSRAFP
jgi:hypothetical protein